MSKISLVLSKLLSDNIAKCIDDMESVEEVRVRIGKRTKVLISGNYRAIRHVASDADISHILAIASKSSIFAVEQSISRGFISTECGIRIGVCGEAIYDGGKYKTLKNIASLIIRAPHEVKSLPIAVQDAINPFVSTLIVSPPSGGKTTMLREIARRISNKGERVVIIDERYEISGISCGKPELDIGENTDIIAGTDKLTAYEIAIRGCNPSVLVTDEIFGRDDVYALSDCVRSGIKILASMHGNSLNAITRVDGISDIFNRVLLLDGIPNIGKVIDIVDLS